MLLARHMLRPNKDLAATKAQYFQVHPEGAARHAEGGEVEGMLEQAAATELSRTSRGNHGSDG